MVKILKSMLVGIKPKFLSKITELRNFNFQKKRQSAKTKCIIGQLLKSIKYKSLRIENIELIGLFDLSDFH